MRARGPRSRPARRGTETSSSPRSRRRAAVGAERVLFGTDNSDLSFCLGKILGADLSEEQREAFRLKFQDQLSYREIGQVMGVSLGTLSNLITAALGTLRQQLRAGGHLAQEG